MTKKQEQTLLAKAEDYGLTRLQAREIIDELLKEIGGRRVKTEESVNYYEVLGVSQDATTEQIEEAHQKLYAASLAKGGVPGEEARRNLLTATWTSLSIQPDQITRSERRTAKHSGKWRFSMNSALSSRRQGAST